MVTDPRTVAVGYPPGYDPGTVAVPPPPRRPAAAPAPAPAPLYDADLGPDVPWGPPITLAQVAELAVSQGVDPATLPAATRAAYEAAQPAQDRAAPIRDRARDMLSTRLHRLAEVADTGTPSEVVAAIRELGKIADVYEGARQPAQVGRTLAQVEAEIRAAIEARARAMVEERSVVHVQTGGRDEAGGA